MGRKEENAKKAVLLMDKLPQIRNIDIAARGLDPNFLRTQAPVAAVSVGLALRSGDER